MTATDPLEPESPQGRQLIEIDDELIRDIEELVRSRSDLLLINILKDLYPADIAHIMNRLDTESAAYLFGILPTDTASDTLLEVDDVHREHLLKTLSQPRLTEIVDEMESDDAADIVGELPEEKQEQVLEQMDTADSSQVEELLRYEENTAGGLMGKEFVRVGTRDTIKKAIREVRKQAKERKNVHNVYVVDENGLLAGVVPLADLLLHTPNKRMHSIVGKDVLSVTADVDQEEVARMFRKYDIVSLPVTDKAGKLLGRITIDDVVDVLDEEHEEDVARMTGGAATEVSQSSPVRVAMLRLPWVLMTLAMQLMAGVVVHWYDATLSRVILLASFMPIISAISGNTGLQAAAVIVRGLATGHVDLTRWWIPLQRQLLTTLIIGAVCGAALGVIGWIWHGNALFGLVVGASMFISINISGFIGTATPMISRSFGLDPAITAGPFETAFQDIVGITIFLTIATMLLQWL